MSRKALRWLIFFGLLGVVVSVAVMNAVSNAKFVSRLHRADPSAFAEFSERPDLYNLFISMAPPARLKLVEALGSWNSPSAPATLVLLARDPDLRVRAALVDAMARQATAESPGIVATLATSDPAGKAIVVEAVSRSGEAGRRVAEAAFSDAGARETASNVLIRFGGEAQAFLAARLGDPEVGVALDAADVLVRIGRKTTDAGVPGALWALYDRLTTQQERDRLLPILAEFGVGQAQDLFVSTLRDETAPTKLRAASALGLRQIGAMQYLGEFQNDPDPEVREAAMGER